MSGNGTCKSCKFWGVNRDAELNGADGAQRALNSHCENADIRKSIHADEVSLPVYIVPRIMKSFVTRWTFNCAKWEEAKDWEQLWR